MISDEELASRCRTAQLGKIVPEWIPRLLAFRGAEGETLLHVSQRGHVVAALLAIGLDPNARDARGRTPLMWPYDLDGNRRLIESGANVLAENARGNTTLAHQSGGLISSIGYSGPDFAALEVLLDSGVRRPTEEEARRWVESSRASVTHHAEHSEFKRFEAWVERLAARPFP
jgi:ankyrin repeat protein